ncbi:MAG: hypothetical protein KDI50_13595, partial [Candidatus Competibacteraceae bacterium]|nr:hypothetical protein [Candidatus Competibacteraceae bacterium]
PAPLAEVLNWLAIQLGVPEPSVVASPALKPGSNNGSGLASRQRASKRCRNARLRGSGFQFRYPSYRDGYATLLRATADGAH